MAKRALVVLDVQNEYFDGALPISVVRHTSMTHMCVDTTSRQPAHRGCAVEILNDATGTLARENSGGAAAGEELHRATRLDC